MRPAARLNRFYPPVDLRRALVVLIPESSRGMAAQACGQHNRSRRRGELWVPVGRRREDGRVCRFRPGGSPGRKEASWTTRGEGSGLWILRMPGSGGMLSVIRGGPSTMASTRLTIAAASVVLAGLWIQGCGGNVTGDERIVEVGGSASTGHDASMGGSGNAAGGGDAGGVGGTAGAGGALESVV